MSSETTWDEAEAFDAYVAYGADLIRTAGILVGATPSVIFRATVLFQRFEKVVNENFRVHYHLPSDMAKLRAAQERLRNDPLAKSDSSFYPSSSDHDDEDAGDDDAKSYSGESESSDQDQPNGCQRVEYIVPEHVNKCMPSGLLPLVDLLAPLDYCVRNIIAHEDISYLSAACLLIAAKLEQPFVNVRALTTVFVRLSLRRCGMLVPDDIALAAGSGGPTPSAGSPDPRYEDTKLNITKAEELVLHMLGFQTFVNSPYKYCQVFLSLMIDDAGTSSAYVACLKRACSWLNDAPRSAALALSPAATLAAVAIHCALPSTAVLPEAWWVALGVRTHDFHSVRGIYESCRAQWVASSPVVLDGIRSRMPPPQYLTLSQWQTLQGELGALSVTSSRHSSVDRADDAGTQDTPPPAPQGASAEPDNALAELAQREFVDIREIQRQRRQKEEEREKQQASTPVSRVRTSRARTPQKQATRKRSRSPSHHRQSPRRSTRGGRRTRDRRPERSDGRDRTHQYDKERDRNRDRGHKRR